MNILVNGKLVEDDENIVSQKELSFNYGYGLFETIKLENNRLFFLEEHFCRLYNSCKDLGIGFNLKLEEIHSQIMNLVKENGINAGSVKLIYTKDKKLIISTGVSVYEACTYRTGYKLCFSEYLKNPHSKLTFLKSMNYLENIMAKTKAKEKGFDETLFLNIYGYLTEGSFTNVFFVKNACVFTPSISCGLLDGVVRNKVIHLLNNLNIKLICDCFYKEDVLSAEEVFLTNSLMEIMPVCRLEKKEFSLESNTITKLIMREFKKTHHQYCSV